MTTETEQNKIQPNFSHRIGGDITTPLGLVDAVGAMTSRAKGVLKLLLINQLEGNVVADHIAAAAIESAIAEVEDIEETVNAFHSLSVAGGVK